MAKEVTNLYKILVLPTDKFARVLGKIFSGKIRYKTVSNRIIDFEDFSETISLDDIDHRKPLQLHRLRVR